MASTDQSVVSYGHFGRSNYSRIDREWQFQRNVKQALTLEQFSGPEVLHHPEVANEDQSDTQDHERPATRRKKQTQTLIQAHPEIQPAIDLLPELARVSEAVEDAATHFDPNRSHLLAFSSINDVALNRSAIIAAFPTGPSGGDLCLNLYRNVDTGWEDSRHAFLTVPTPTSDSAVWHGPGVPIQQIVFACHQEPHQVNYLAVRLITKTLIFRPFLKRTSSSPHSLPAADLFVEIPIDETGGSPHADITFNPWHTRQIGIIDQAGRWSVWELTGRSHRSVERMYQGELSRSMPDGGSLREMWARILWITNASTLVLCDRLTVDTLELSIKMLAEEAVVADGSGLSKGWILDMTTIPNRPAHFVVLTTTHVGISHLNDPAIDSPSKKSLLSLRHRLNPLDISLRVRCFENDDEPFLALHSATTSVILVFPLQFISDHQITASDPFELTLPCGVIPGILGLHIEQIHFAGRLNTEQRLAATYAAKQIKFFSITALAKDLSITRWRYVDARGLPQDGIRPVAWERKNPATSSEVPAQSELICDDATDVDSDMEHDDSAPQERPVSAFLQRLQEGKKVIEEHDRTVIAHLAARELDCLGVEHATDFGEIIDEAKAVMRNQEQHFPLQTLRELLPGEVTLRDEASAVGQLESIRQLELEVQIQHIKDEHMEPEERRARLVMRDIPLPHDARGDDASKDIIGVHRELSRIHATDLPTVPPELEFMQTSRKAHVLRLAAEISLASQVLRHEYPTAEGQSDLGLQSQSQGQTIDQGSGQQFSQLSATSSTNNPLQDYLEASSQLTSTLPTPSPTATPSLITTSCSPYNLTSLELSTLSKYTTFTNPYIAPNVPPRFQRNVLNDWTPGADPASYDWQFVSRTLLNPSSANDPTNFDETEMTDRERRSLQRKAERHVLRQRREAEESRRLNAQRNSLPWVQSVGASASQPGQMRLPVRTGGQGGFPATQSGGHLPSSQSGFGMSSQLQGPPMASQILPGRHGGRPPLKKKKRRAGF